MGWHIPSNDEWNILINFLGGSEVASGKLKEDGFNHWVYPNIADNISGFTALPGGVELESGHFINGTNRIDWYKYLGSSARFCTKSIYSDNITLYNIISMENTTGICSLTRNYKYASASVRCIKD